MVKYLGSKRLLIATILDTIAQCEDVHTVADLFSGTARVGYALKQAGYRVISNDCLAFANTIATCYVQADYERVADDAERIINDLNRLPGSPGYVTDVFCEQSRFFQPKNGERIDAIRAQIARLSLRPELEAVVLTSLIEAADRVDSTTGVQMAYVKQWAKRSYNDLELRIPHLLPQSPRGPGRALMMDALEAARRVHVDLAYLDPPYNQHSYLGNYHIWETIVRGDSPEHYGVACKRTDCRERKSAFNSKPRAEQALADVVKAIDARYLLVSFSDEGYISREAIEGILGERGPVHTISVPFRRYVGARIGIHNQKGDRVGTVGKLNNTEYLFLVGPTKRVSEEAQPERSSVSAAK